MHRHTHERLPAAWWISIVVGLTASLWVGTALAVMLLLLVAQAVLLLS
jgi:hypothetical protein